MEAREARAKEYIATLHERSKGTYLAETWYCIAVRILGFTIESFEMPE
jgi:hypothetical protein